MKTFSANQMTLAIASIILISIVLGCGGNSQQTAEDANAKEMEQRRIAIAKELDKKFDIYPECLFHFRAEGTQSKRLYVRNCAPKKGITQPDEFLEPQDIKTLKRLGFEEIEILSLESVLKSYTTIWRFNDNDTLRFIKYK